MKYEIMLKILFELLAKKVVSAKYLADKYSVSVRSIYRYIECIELAGVPIYTNRGNNGGFSIIDSYRLSSTFFTSKEYEQVISTLESINSNINNNNLSSAITKLKSSVRNEVSGIDIKSGNLIIDAGPWGDTLGYKSKLAIMQKCIDETLQVEISYHDRNGSITKRIIEPHVMVFKQGLWYVYAYCNLRKTFRFFKTGRIETANVLNTKFIRQDLSTHDLPLDFWHNSVNTERIELLIKDKCRSDLEEWLGIENVYKKDEKYYASVSLPFDDGLVYKLMSYGDGVTILSPKKLVDKIKENAQNLLKNY